MRFVLLALVFAASATAQTSLAGGSSAYLSVGNADVVGPQTWVDIAAGWRWSQGTDVGLFFDEQRAPDDGGSYSDRSLGVEAGTTWRVSPAVGVRLSGSASLDRLSFDDVTVFVRRPSDVGSSFRQRQATATFEGASATADAFVFVRLRLAGSVGVQPGLGLFVHHESLTSDDPDASLFALGPVRDPRDAAGAVVSLPVTARVLGADLALSPIVRLGVGVKDHAFWADGGMRLHVNL